MFSQEIWVIGVASLVTAGLTFFSGFGLGTLLMPVFAWFLPVPQAVAATAIVHLANNIFKVGVMPRQVDWAVIRRFALPAVLATFLGAWLLSYLGQLPPWGSYKWLGHTFWITPVKALIGMLMMGFALLELSPTFSRWSVSARWLPVGGMLSGFFGGLSGHQGALRSAFLIRLGLEKSVYVSTVIVAAILVDMTRLMVYGLRWQALQPSEVTLVVTGCVAAFAGTFIGARLLHKVTMGHIQKLVGLLLVVYGVALVVGWI